MSLATRCTSCGTIFRVVQDQLKVSEGWVRCGRCQNVFNALQNLFDLDREQPPPWTPAPAPPAEPETPTWAATQPLDADQPTAGSPSAGMPLPDAASRAPVSASVAASAAPPAVPRAPQSRASAPAAAATLAGSAPASLLHTASRESDLHEDTEALSTQPEIPPPERDDGESSGFLHARFNVDLVHDRGNAAASTAEMHAPAAATAEAAPLFVRQAERAARWRRPQVRAALGLLLLLLLATLLGQIALQFRNPLAAAWPEARDPLHAMCEQLDCRIEPPRRLDSLTVDASGLTRAPTAGVYRLSVALHNHSHTIVMVPAVDLSLTDAQGRLFARRTLLPRDLGATQASVAPGADLTLQAVLSTGAERVVGYTVEIFYP